jgi:hypothetical protein
MQALCDAGIFALGGVLVGASAFGVLGNLLGVHLPPRREPEDSIDIAFPAKMPAAPSVIEQLEMGLSPGLRFSQQRSCTLFADRGKQVHVNFFAPQLSSKLSPIRISTFAAFAQPTRYLELLLERVRPAAFVGKSSSLVTVPDPARFALHATMAARVCPAPHGRDAELRRASALLDVLAQDHPEALRCAREAIDAHSLGARELLREGLAELSVDLPQVAERLKCVWPSVSE